MKKRKFFRDGLEETIIGPVKRKVTRDGHTIEVYTLDTGETRYFATLFESPFCAHGSTEAEAITDALWKDESKRPNLEKLKEEIKKEGPERKISLNEFKYLTGACSEGCRVAIKKAKHDGSPLTAFEIRDKISKEWGYKVIQMMDWTE